jgi:uncharacterized protein YndB with AHSA1/START domain
MNYISGNSNHAADSLEPGSKKHIMPAIHHQVGIAGSVEEVFTVLTTLEGLASWWTRDTRGESRPGEIIEFYFDAHRMDMQVLEQLKNERVRWRSVGGDEQWQDTEIVFKLHHDGRQTLVDFTHEKWRDATELFSHCSTKWAVFLLSLKDLVETGAGKPYPDDIQISHS